jgi:hypothetical protein
MRSKPVEVTIIVLIILYVLLVMVYLAVDHEGTKQTFQIIELCFLVVFSMETFLNLIGFGRIFVAEYWNTLDIIASCIAIILVSLEITASVSALANFFQLRGFFRLLMIVILIRKFYVIMVRRQARDIVEVRDIFHMSSPVEMVNEILSEIRDMAQTDDKMYNDLNYCIKMVASGKLYETNLFDGEHDATSSQTNDELNWVKSIKGLSKLTKLNSMTTRILIKSRLQNINITTTLGLTKESQEMLDCVDTCDNFNIFDFKNEVNEQELYVISSYLMHKHELFQTCKIDPESYFKFIKRIQDNYNPKWIDYHNKSHGADVCQMSYFFLEGCNFKEIGNVSDLDLMSIIISSSCHDFEHPGVNNAYLVNSRSQWALEYNDKSPLENHHIAATFMIIEHPSYAIFKDLNADEFKDVRKKMIGIVLATDAAFHFDEVGKFKARIGSEDFDPTQDDDRMMVVKMMVHLADISNPCKPFNISLIWTGLLYDEFFKQGDSEASDGRNISYLMDRKTINIAGSSIGFANMLVKPAYELLVQVIPKAQVCLDLLEQNVKKWGELKDEYEKKMNDGENLVVESQGKIKKTD